MENLLWQKTSVRLQKYSVDNTDCDGQSGGNALINTVGDGQINNSEWKKGEEAAYFSFGSTVILLFENGAFQKNEHLVVPAEVKNGCKR